jgi:hypothetical protein
MMRLLACIPIALVAGCGGETAENKAEPVAATFAPGQWELTTEVTGFRQADQGRPSINTPVGTRATGRYCVARGHELPTEFFSDQGYRCNYGSYYVRNGRVNVTLSCTRAGLSGSVSMSADGTFQAASVEFQRDLRTALDGDGDVVVTARITGRRTGDCTPETDEGGTRNGHR